MGLQRRLLIEFIQYLEKRDFVTSSHEIDLESMVDNFLHETSEEFKNGS